MILFFPLSVRVFPITTPKIKKSEGAGGFLFLNNMQKCVSISKTKRSLLPSWVILRTNKTRAPISLWNQPVLNRVLIWANSWCRSTRSAALPPSAQAPLPLPSLEINAHLSGFFFIIIFPSPAIAPWLRRFAAKSPKRLWFGAGEHQLQPRRFGSGLDPAPSERCRDRHKIECN